MNIFKFNTKTLFASISLGLIFSIFISVAYFDAKCEVIRDSVLRLHILANSDSQADQQIKLKVRDAVLDECGDLFCNIKSTEEAINIAQNNLDRLTHSAQKELSRLGCDYSAKIEIAPTDFGTRRYNEVTLPAGEYMAVRILLGEAKGKNWWCVCFPNMCLPAASEREKINSVLDSESSKIVTESQNFKIKLKIVEVYEDLKNRWLDSKNGKQN